MAKSHHLPLFREQFEMVQQGIKNVDMRLLDEAIASVKSGDTIVYNVEFDESKLCRVTVKDIQVYKDFDELLEAIPLGALGRQNKDLIRVNLNRFYSEEDRKRYKAVAVWIEKIDM